VPEGYEQTFGEMEPSLKDSISHRARAFEKMMLAAYDDD
jgi:XTP/dITP diphosphohydrolase